MILHGCHLVNEFPGQTGHSGLVACVRDGNNIQTQTPGSTGRYQNNKGVVASSGSGNPMRGDVQVCSIGDPGDFNNSATCADIQAVLISTGSLSTSVRNGIKETLNDVYKVFDTGTTNIFTPNYNSSIKFTSDNSAWRGSDFNSFIMANGLNNIKADLNLNFILNTKDSINLLNFIENKTTGIVTGETAFDGRNTVINFGENQNGFQINLDTGYYNNFSGSHITNYNIRKLAHNVNQIDLTLSNNRTSSFLSNGEGFVKKTFYPDHISGLGFWVDASDTGTILLSGNAGSTAPLFTGITGVVDKVRGVTGVCNPSGVVYRSGFINNNSVIYTSGGPGGQDLGIKWKLGQGFNVDRESHEMFALVSMNVDEDENVGFFGDASYRQGGAMFSFFGDTLLYTTNKNGHDTSDGNNTISFSNYPLITGKFFLVNGVLSGNRDVEFNVNGGSFSTGSGALSTNDTLTTFQYPLGQFPRRATSNGFTIFDGPQGGHSNDFIGSFAEGLVYNRALTPNERQLVVEYFTKKWGTELTVFKDDFNNGNTGNQLVDNNTQSFNDFRFLTRGDLAIISSGTQATDTTSYTFPGDGVLRLTFEPSGSESNTGFYSNKVFGLRYGTFEHSAVDGGLDDGANYLFEFEGRVNNGGGSNSGSLHFDINDRYVQSITGTSTSDFIKFTQHIDNFPGSEGRSDASGRFFDIVLKTNQNQGVVSVDIKNVKVTEQNKFASQGDTDRQFHVRKIDANSNIFDNYFYATGETLVGLNSAQSYSGLSTYTGSVGVYTRTFFWEPDLSVEISNDVSSRINNLKGSFNELLNISKNQNMVQSLDLEFSNRGRAETYAILHFLETHLGYKTFSYQHQDDLIKKNKIYYCPTWEHTFNYFNSNTIKARFVEVPTPITPNF
jgi:phage-related protein